MIVGVCGVGNFGYAILKHLDNKYSDSPEVRLRAYDYDTNVTSVLEKTHKHPQLFTDVQISDSITVVTNYKDLATDCDLLILAFSSDATRSAIRGLKPHLKNNVMLVNTAKALDYETGKRLSVIIGDELTAFQYTYAVLSGGTIASDLFAHQPLGIDIASENSTTLATARNLFTAPNLYVHASSDILGVELAGALKNIVSVIAGIVKGLGFSYGSETHIISVTAQAIADACVKMGASPATFQIGSQSWGNDMWMSATGNTRNRQFGELIGTTKNIATALKTMADQHKTVEAARTLEAVKDYPQVHSIPAISALYDLYHKQITFPEFEDRLFKVD